MKPTIIAVACTLLFAGSSAFAADSSEVELLKQQLQVMQQQMSNMQNKIDAISASPVATAAPAAAATPGQSPLSVNIGGASVTLYGNADLSAEQTSNGKETVSQVSSNLSYLGVRASSKELGTSGLKAIAQFETLVNVSGTPTEASGLGSRNSFLGIEAKFGKLMLGKTDTPYKRATASMDPFSASVGDYNAIMGNTGGDLRAEFDARLPHSIFYDSPNMNGFSVNALFSPGQKYDNLANSDKYAYAQGEKVCSGATPGSSGSTPDSGSFLCNDGAFKNAGSVAVNYANGPLFATVSYERHDAVDRTSDTGGVTSNESAAKIGVTYNFGKNRLSAIYEKFYRAGGIDPTVNERARDGYFISDVQELGNGLDLMASWAHARQTPGSPDFLTADDHANMYALGLKYHYDKQTSIYLVGALLNQGAGAHYALGAGGHGVAIAAPRDADGATIGGQSIKALSVGMQYSF